jgi:hypothetical protein
MQALGDEVAGDRSHRKVDVLDVRNSQLGRRRSKVNLKARAGVEAEAIRSMLRINKEECCHDYADPEFD